MKKVSRVFVLLVLLLLCQAQSLRAHVGSPDVFFDGKVGSYPAHITIRMPPVIPGRAQIEVRPQTDKPVNVTFLPLYSRTSIKNTPPAEAAVPVTGDPGLYAGELWLMSVGAYSIEVRVNGEFGEGSVEIPVNSVATHQLPLPPFLGNLLLVLGGLLSIGGLAIVYAAAGESILAPSSKMQKKERSKGLLAGGIAALLLVAFLTGGWAWWKADEREFRRTLREGAWPDLAATVATEGHQRVLHLVLGEKTFAPDYTLRLLADHGKQLHLFLVREPAHDVFAHVHPVRRGGKAFDLLLPELPEGDYRIMCDVTLSDSGLSSTAAGRVHIPPPPTDGAAAVSDSALQADADDSWAAAVPVVVSSATTSDVSFALPGGREAIWKAHPPLRAKHEAHLDFVFRDSAGQPLPLEPYMGMMSHAAVMRTDGAVFSHLHPTGNFSMASQSFFATKIAREASGNSGNAPEEMDHSKMDHSKMGHGSMDGTSGSVFLPYEFPTPGTYQIWVQAKTEGQVLTAAFETTVAP